MEDKKYLSFGGGVNSVALLLFLKERGESFEAVFADHGCDWPETYEYVNTLIRKGYPITILKTRRNGLNIYDYCLKYKVIPSVRFRWCTEHWKVRPLREYYDGPAYDLIGIDAGESHRAKYRETDNKVVADYPLVRLGIDRKGCVDVIKKHGLKVPQKSGCFFCFYQRPDQFRSLRDLHPDLFCKVLKLDEMCREKARLKGKKPFFLKNIPILDFIQHDQGDLFDGFIEPCHCLI
jgi:hypothetical protein